MEQCLLNFEAACWRALADVFPDVSYHGCVFHWKQAVWRQVQGAGLQAAYQNKDGVYKLVSKLLALPYLPSEVIPVLFENLKEKAAGCDMVKRVSLMNVFILL